MTNVFANNKRVHTLVGLYLKALQPLTWGFSQYRAKGYNKYCNLKSFHSNSNMSAAPPPRGWSTADLLTLARRDAASQGRAMQTQFGLWDNMQGFYHAVDWSSDRWIFLFAALQLVALCSVVTVRLRLLSSFFSLLSLLLLLSFWFFSLFSFVFFRLRLPPLLLRLLFRFFSSFLLYLLTLHMHSTIQLFLSLAATCRCGMVRHRPRALYFSSGWASACARPRSTHGAPPTGGRFLRKTILTKTGSSCRPCSQRP